ncbi:hypothetical protein HDV01_006227 [Terramyces sp. JEL0728]|nr:hypothetical protein HDV01_006227 [Terramyces sp. JEL0728]
MLRKLINRILVIDLPWSSRRFTGYDLDGNMYFEEPSRREELIPTIEELQVDLQRKETTKTLVEALESKEKAEPPKEFQPASWNPKKIQ